MELPFAEAWKIKMVEPIKKSTREQREKWLLEAHNNIFMLKSDYVYIDLLTEVERDDDGRRKLRRCPQLLSHEGYHH